jgi:iron(III) transport system permease protein
VETLATQFWAYEQDVSYYQAALYAGVMVLIAAVPGYILGRWFDRQPARMAADAQSTLDVPSTMVPV